MPATHRGSIALALTFGSALLSGCGPEGDFLDALNSHDSSKLCVEAAVLGISLWKNDQGQRFVSAKREDSFSFGANAQEVDALAPMLEEGYLGGPPTPIQTGAFFSTKFIDGYALTDKGMQFLGEDRVCLGSKHATSVIDYTEPGQAQGVAQVRFEFDVAFNDYIEDLGLDDALAQGATLSKRGGKGEAVFQKTNNGWRLEFADW